MGQDAAPVFPVLSQWFSAVTVRSHCLRFPFCCLSESLSCPLCPNCFSWVVFLQSHSSVWHTVWGRGQWVRVLVHKSGLNPHNQVKSSLSSTRSLPLWGDGSGGRRVPGSPHASDPGTVCKQDSFSREGRTACTHICTHKHKCIHMHAHLHSQAQVHTYTQTVADFNFNLVH